MSASKAPEVGRDVGDLAAGGGTLWGFIWSNSWRRQLVIVALTLVGLPLYYASLLIPKLVVNDVLGTFYGSISVLGVEFPELTAAHMLLALCGLYLLLVAIQGLIKYALNVYKGLTGERLLRGLRRAVCARVLHVPEKLTAEMSSDELAAMTSSELDPVGGFAAEAVALPALQGGLLVTALVFVFTQDWRLGLAAVVLLPFQAFVTPLMQRRINRLSVRRIATVRSLSTRIGESVDRLDEIRAARAHDTVLAGFDGLLGRILEVRYALFRAKAMVKLANNLLFQLAPFALMLAGGYLVLEQQLTLGALVAVLVAYKDLPPPARELLGYYQDYQDARVKFTQVLGRLPAVPRAAAAGVAAEGVAAEGVAAGGVGAGTSGSAEPAPAASGPGWRVEGLVLGGGEETDQTDTGDRFDLQVAPGEHLPVTGLSVADARSLALLLLGVRSPSEGTVYLDGRRVGEWPGAALARTVDYVPAVARLFRGSVRQNLQDPRVSDTSTAALVAAFEQAGVGLDMVRLGLTARLDASAESELIAALVEAAPSLRAAHTDVPKLDPRLTPVAQSRVWSARSVGENLLGVRADPSLADDGPTLSRALLAQVAPHLTPALRRLLLEAALAFDVGIGGANLSLAQSQRLAISRSLLLGTRATILVHPTGALPTRDALHLIASYRAAVPTRTLVWCVESPALLEAFAPAATSCVYPSLHT